MRPPGARTRRISAQAARRKCTRLPQKDAWRPQGKLDTMRSKEPSGIGKARASHTLKFAAIPAALAFTLAAETDDESMSPPKDAAPNFPASARIVPAPQQGSSSDCPGAIPTSLSIAAATGGLSEPALCAFL